MLAKPEYKLEMLAGSFTAWNMALVLMVLCQLKKLLAMTHFQLFVSRLPLQLGGELETFSAGRAG